MLFPVPLETASITSGLFAWFSILAGSSSESPITTPSLSNTVILISIFLPTSEIRDFISSFLPCVIRVLRTSRSKFASVNNLSSVSALSCFSSSRIIKIVNRKKTKEMINRLKRKCFQNVFTFFPTLLTYSLYPVLFSPCFHIYLVFLLDFLYEHQSFYHRLAFHLPKSFSS